MNRESSWADQVENDEEQVNQKNNNNNNVNNTNKTNNNNSRDYNSNNSNSRDRNNRDNSNSNNRRNQDNNNSNSRNSNRSNNNNSNVEEISAREHGFVTSLKDKFGFIECVDSNRGELFFHYSEVNGDYEHIESLRRGSELSFIICRDKKSPDRLYASKVSILPKGTIELEKVIEANCIGTIEKELIGQRINSGNNRNIGNNRQEAYGGKVKKAAASVQDKENKTDSNDINKSSPAIENNNTLYEFSERDLVNPTIPLYLGDEIEFSIFEERRSKRLGATKVRLRKFNAQNRKRAVVISLKENFGFLQAEEKAFANKYGDIFFHYSELIDMNNLDAPNNSSNGNRFAMGDELEFDLQHNDNDRQAKPTAVRIIKLPKGTIKVDTIDSKFTNAIITKAPQFEESTSSNNKESRRPKLVNGELEYEDNDGKKQQIIFNQSDIKLDRDRNIPILLLGDKVQFNIQTLATSNNEKRAKNIQLQSNGYTKLNREQGIIVSVRDNFSFIDCVSRTEKMFLHNSQFLHSLNELKPGVEVEFNVTYEMPGKLSAVRANILPKGTVKFEDVLPFVFNGIIAKRINLPIATRDKVAYLSKVRRDNNDHNYQEKGELKVTQIPNELNNTNKDNKDNNNTVSLQPVKSVSINDLLSFTENDIEINDNNNNITPLLLPGDQVEFKLQIRKQNNTQSITQIKLLQAEVSKREKGIISSITYLGSNNSNNSRDSLLSSVGKIMALNRSHLVNFTFESFGNDIINTIEELKQIKVDDCVEFDIVSAIDNQSGKTAEYAVRINKLAAASVVVETIDLNQKYRGTVVSIPIKTTVTQKGRQGTITLDINDAALVREQTLNNNSIDESLEYKDIHPASITSNLRDCDYDVIRVHPAAIISIRSQPQLQAKATKSDQSVKFVLSNVTDGNVLAEYDSVEFNLAIRTGSNITGRRAVNVKLLPLQATVETVNNSGSESESGLLSSLSRASATANQQPEQLIFHIKNVNNAPNGLNIGDLVEILAADYDNNKRKRIAKNINRLKEAPKSIGNKSNNASNTTNNNHTTSDKTIQQQSRFARGPPNETDKGFTRIRTIAKSN
jgi:cold shock CspA family protein